MINKNKQKIKAKNNKYLIRNKKGRKEASQNNELNRNGWLFNILIAFKNHIE